MINKFLKAVQNPCLAINHVISKVWEFYLTDLIFKNKRQQYIKTGEVTAVYNTKDNYSKHWFFPRYAKGQMHEPITTKLILNALKPEDIFVDVGAHLGYYTCLIGKFLTKGKVYSFEMDVNAFKLLKKNVRLNNLKNVKIYNKVVAEENKIIEINNYLSPRPCLSLVETNIAKLKNKVITIYLDNFFKYKKNKPTVLKIDVEGAELLVLKGMKSLLTKENLKIFLELHSDKITKFNSKPENVINYLKKSGYEVFEILNHRSKSSNVKKRLKKFDLDMKPTLQNTMCLAVKKPNSKFINYFQNKCFDNIKSIK